MENKTSSKDKTAEIPVLTQAAARTDVAGALAVEIAIALSHVLGVRVAARFLSRHRIRFETALRVLLHPERRRRYGA